MELEQLQFKLRATVNETETETRSAGELEPTVPHLASSQRTVYRYAQRLRTLDTPPPTVPQPPKPGRVAGWIMSDPDHLASGSALTLKETLVRCPELEATRKHVGTFANMIQNLGGNRLPEWIEQVRADGLPELHRSPMACNAICKR